METTIINSGSVEILDNKMETTIVYWVLYGDNGKIEWKLL